MRLRRIVGCIALAFQGVFVWLTWPSVTAGAMIFCAALIVVSMVIE
jgi:hypothetical protein